MNSPKPTEAEQGPAKHPSGRDHGELPDWETGEVPETLPFSPRNIFKMIGPGAILLAGSIGGGEWIIGPMTAVKYGTGILWIATIGIFFQYIFNLEAIRYTLATGEPIITGFMRLKPGPRFWGVLFILLGVCQLSVPALGAGCAQVLFTAAMGREPTAADSRPLIAITLVIVVAAVLLLLSGKSVEKTLERLSWIMIVLIMGFLLVANVLFVPFQTWVNTAKGFVVPKQLPANVDWILLATFAATAGSGGLGNLTISSWSRDKGLGMGKYMGSIGGALSSNESTLASVGWTFIPTAENIRRWRTWWYYSLFEQSTLWAFGCVIGMYMNVNLALAIVPAAEAASGVKAEELSGYSAGAFQAAYMAKQLWIGFWGLALLNGAWILFSVQLGNMDVLARNLCDTLWAGWPSMQKWRPAMLYATILVSFATFGSLAVFTGKNALDLFKILGVVANPILAISSFAALRVNTRFLPPEIKPSWWRCVALFGTGVLYTVLSAVSLYAVIKPFLAK